MAKIKGITTAFIGITAFRLIFSAAAQAESALDAYKQGNAAYASGQFSQAVSAYESARGQGFVNGTLYYNLGNAYYKSGETGLAVVNYLRAFRMQSNNRDVVYNLNLALSKVGEPLVPGETLAALFWRLFYVLTIDALAVLCSLLFIGVCIGGALFFTGRWRPRAEPAAAGVLVLAILGLWLGARVSLVERAEGVIRSGTAEVRAAPNLNTPANFTIPEGRRVLILKQQEPIKGWLEIGVPQEGLKGWVPDTAVEPV